MKHYLSFAFVIVLAALFSASALAQSDTFIGQITNSSAESFIGGVSGDGRFVVFESKGDLATENPDNADGNLEIFLFDYAQRRIFQITHTKSLLYDDSGVDSLGNVRVEIVNTRPVISNDGRYIAFSSNATVAYPGIDGDPTHPPIISSTNPGSFDGNAYTVPTPTPVPTPAPPSSGPLPEGYTKCADEGGTCNFNGNMAFVAYGAGNNFNFLTLVNTTPCTNDVFGDPASGVTKSCYYKVIASATPTPDPSATPTPTPTPGLNSLSSDGNLEMWIYEIPAHTDLSESQLSSGAEVSFVDLAAGTFTQVSNTIPSQLPRGGTTTVGPFVADDNHDASISNDGGIVAFVSTRNLAPAAAAAVTAQEQESATPAPPVRRRGLASSLAATTASTDSVTADNTDNNDEIFTYVRSGGTTVQITSTPRGNIANPIYNKNVSISGDGQHIVFASTGENPIVGFSSCGANPSTSRNEEIFFANISEAGAATSCKQVTTTTPTNAGDPVNILDLGRRISNDGRYIAFDSYADLAGENSGTNYTSFALYLYDTVANTFKRVGPRSDADSAASGGDLAHYPGFTFDAQNNPVLVMETRENIKSDGTIPTTESDGLNPDVVRGTQLYYVPIATPFTFTRITKFPAPSSFLASSQPLTTNSTKRLAFNLAQTELGTGNTDLSSEAYYLIDPPAASTANVDVNFATGATALPIKFTAGPTPTPTQQPSPTPSPTATPDPPVTENPVKGMSPGSIVTLTFATAQPISPASVTGSIARQFDLPLELSGVTLSINGLACGLRSVDGNQLSFVVPIWISSTEDGSIYPYVINNNGIVTKGWLTIVPTRPDIFRMDGVIGPGGRAKLFNITNRVHTTEPFTVTTVKIKGGVRTTSIMRLYATGVANADPSVISIRIGSLSLAATATATAVTQTDEPGIYMIDFPMPSVLNGTGDQPVILSLTAGSTIFYSRVDDTTSFTRIL